MTFARACLLLALLMFVLSGIGAVDRKVWFMETVPVALGGVCVALRWARFPWTSLSVALMTAFFLVLCVGGHWTFSLVPLGNWLRDALGWQRNPWDRVSHFGQGVVSAMLGRELLLRCTGLRAGKALFWVCAGTALGIAAFHELVEWWTVLIAAPDQGLAYLGVQGDVWDAQQDMLMALCGALIAQVLLARWQDRQLARLTTPR